jgi:hypothetical protein
LQALSSLESQQERKKENRRKIIAGSVLLTAALNDAAFAAVVRQKLKAGLTKPADIELFNDWLTAGHESNAANKPPPAAPVVSYDTDKEKISINE